MLRGLFFICKDVKEVKSKNSKLQFLHPIFQQCTNLIADFTKLIFIQEMHQS